MKAKVLVYGSGGRDHCLADKYAESPHVEKVYFAPGNPGVTHTAKGREGLIERVKLKDFLEVAQFCVEKGVSLVDVGSENPLEEGLVDTLIEANSGLRVVGPVKKYVRLESDRAFTSDFLRRIGVPKPEYRIFDDPGEAEKFVRHVGHQVVVKANSLAAGKGVIVCNDVPDAEAAIEKIMVKKIFGRSGERIVIEKRKYGTEISFFVYLDGQKVWPLRMLCQDYKPAFDPADVASIEQFGGNLNTGGTGCCCPHRLADSRLVGRIINEIVIPTVSAIYNNLDWAYRGVLYFGLNLDPRDELEVFELNVRHGDPEWPVIAQKLKTDIFEIAMAVCDGALGRIGQIWDDFYYVDVVGMEGRSRASNGGWNKGYPGRYGNGHRIVGLENISPDVSVYFAGVDEDSAKGLVTAGGRVLHVVAGGVTLEAARAKAYENIRKIAFLDHYNDNVNCMRIRETIGL